MRKNFFLIIIVFLFSTTMIAQVPHLFKYQGLARDSSGNPISNDTIALRISIHQSTTAGTVVYKETHNPITNEFGSFSINIGGGTVVTGNFLTIPWGRYNFYQEVEMDVTGGTNFVSMGTSQYLSVPYSFSTDSAFYSFRSLLADSAIRSFHAIKSDSAINGIAPFRVSNTLNDNTEASVAIIASANTTGGNGAPAIWARNLGTGPSLVTSSDGRGIITDVYGSEAGISVTNWGGGKALIVEGTTGTAAQFIGHVEFTSGNVHVGGHLSVDGNLSVNGILSKGAGSFKIDHPLDPMNKFLYHSFVESPDMKNIYDGTVITDDGGNATVDLPAYFEALNKDFRYQLTAMGQFAQAIVSEEISNNKFSIKTDKPNVKISWQVTGIRKDAYAEKNRIVPEVEKSKEEKGKYLYPEAFEK